MFYFNNKFYINVYGYSIESLMFFSSFNNIFYINLVKFNGVMSSIFFIEKFIFNLIINNIFKLKKEIKTLFLKYFNYSSMNNKILYKGIKIIIKGSIKGRSSRHFYIFGKNISSVTLNDNIRFISNSFKSSYGKFGIKILCL